MANTKKAPITGVKTETQKAKALATAKGPKPGAARSSQSAKYDADTRAMMKTNGGIAPGPKVSKLVTKPDVIKAVKNTTDGRHVAVEAGGGSLTFPKSAHTAELAKLAAVGASFKALQNWLKTHKPEAKLATGLDSRSAPQSAMAAAESRTGGKPQATGAKAKATAKVSMKGDFTYAVGKANDMRADTWTHHMVTMIQSATDTAAARAKHDKSGRYVGKKLDFTWAKAKGFIK